MNYIEGDEVVGEWHAVTAAEIRIYAALSGDDNPLHLSAEYAARTRFEEPIAHGLLASGLVSALIAKCAPDDHVVFIVRQSMEYQQPVYARRVLRARMQFVSIDAPRTSGAQRARVAYEVITGDGTAIMSGDAVIQCEPLR